MAPQPLSPEALYKACDARALPFETTAELDPVEGLIGQDRAMQAIAFATEIDRQGFNLFVLGPAGGGQEAAVLRLLRERAKREEPPSDWVYVNNFEVAHRPLALELDAGDGRKLKRAMAAAIEDLKSAVPAVLESEDYQNRHQAIDQEFNQRQEQAFEALRQKAEAQNIAVMRTPQGFAMAPVRDGEVMKPEAFNQLPEDERKRIEGEIQTLQRELAGILEELQQWEKERRERLAALNKEVAEGIVSQSLRPVHEAFGAHARLAAWLEAMQADLVDNIGLFAGGESGQGQQAPQNFMQMLAQMQGAGGGEGSARAILRRYEVNVLVSNGLAGLRASELERDQAHAVSGRPAPGDHDPGGLEAPVAEGAPVVFEDHPTFANLMGRVEHMPQLGALVTDFTLVKAGSLHRANGGYLLIDGMKLISDPLAWDALKRAIRRRKIVIESPGEYLSLVSTVSLEPEPIPMSVKIVLFGDHRLYYALSQLDPDFEALFKVVADMDTTIDRGETSDLLYARLLGNLCRQGELLPLDRTGVARAIERASRLADDREKLTAIMRPMSDLLQEADFLARRNGQAAISGAEIEAAHDRRIERASRPQERSAEMITRDIVMIDTDGGVVGQINALSVLSLGSVAFGRPSRITARVRMGTGSSRLVDIEREVDLGGPLHSKGVLILSGYLQAQFLPDMPLSLAATLVFEQSYGGVDGDSASSTELYALLSALAELPIDQGFAVTGSVNQLGEVQAIGGVNEKIEGFFDICAARGLTGRQGVLIPQANVVHLMLKREVREAVARGQFAIYPVARIEEGIELLTGVAAGQRDETGAFPVDSVFGRAEARLKSFAETMRRFARDGGAGARGGEG